MQIDNEFEVQAPPREVWDYLQRTDDVVECIPGATILEKVNDDAYRGQITVKMGPLAVVLQGLVTIDERDREAQKMTLTGRAKDTKGRGATDAGVVVEVVAEGDGTRVTLQSDVKITGKIAQFGRGVMKDVSQRIAEEFARNLEARLSGPSVEIAEPAPEVKAPGGGIGGPAGSMAAPDTAPTSGPRYAVAPTGQASTSVGGLRLVAGALLRTFGAVLGRLLRRIAKPLTGNRQGS
jgi:carbon monoxide dehydrogenase subunit G